MLRVLVIAVLAAAAPLFGSASSAEAQRRPAPAISVQRDHPPGLSRVAPPGLDPWAPGASSAGAAGGPRPRAWPYVVGGALLGAAAVAARIALSIDSAEECLPCSPILFAPHIAGGAGAGAAAGYVVYRIRFR